MNELHLFAGCGGGILGGMLLGHRTVCAVELEPYRRKSLLQRQRDGVFEPFPTWDDVRTFNGKSWKGKVDCICGGFPCQDISFAGKGAGINGKRSGLWKHMARIICEVEPRFVFVENSAAIITRGIGTVLGDLASMGFNAKWGVLGACDAIWLEGTPVFDHERNRCFIAASHPDSLRGSQSERRIEDKRGWIVNGIKKTTNSNNGRWEYSQISEKVKNNTQRNASPFERVRGRISGAVESTDSGWWTTEPAVGRMVHGLADRLDRIKAIGDGQVPAVVKLAWETLMVG